MEGKTTNFSRRLKWLDLTDPDPPPRHILRQLYATVPVVLVCTYLLALVVRCSLMGHDLNRYWQEPSPWSHPALYATKNLLMEMDANEVRVTYIGQLTSRLIRGGYNYDLTST